MKRLVYIIVFALGLTACYDDKGSYDYHDICEVNIEGVESVYETVYRESVLEIDPTVTVTEGNIGDTTRFAYEWRANVAYNSTELIGTERILNYRVELAPRNDYVLYFRVTDRQTGVVTVATSTLKVGTAYSKGILLIGENAQGEADVQMLSMVKDTVLYKELLKNSGLPVLKNPVDIIHTGAAGNSNYIKLWVLTGSQAYSMDRKTFAGSESDVFGKLLFMDRTFDTEFVPVDIIPRVKDKAGKNGGSSYYRTVVCNNGYIFNASTLLMGGDYYNNPVNCLTSDQNTYYKAFPYLFYTLNSYSGGFLWFDVENQRFLTVKNSIAVSDLLEDQAGDPFPWNQGTTGRTLVYGENTLDVGSSNGNSFAILKDPAGAYYLYKFRAVGSGPTKLNCYTIGAGAVDFDKADFYAFSSRRTVVYYAVGATLHAYDYNKGNERHYTFDMGDPITMLYCDTAIEPNANPLYVATYNATTGGKLQKYIQGVNPDKVELEADEKSCWEGLMKIKKMSWRAVE